MSAASGRTRMGKAQGRGLHLTTGRSLLNSRFLWAGTLFFFFFFWAGTLAFNLFALINGCFRGQTLYLRYRNERPNNLYPQ